MDQFKTNLLNLERKVKILLAEYKSVKDELVLVIQENSGLKEHLKQKDEQIGHFQNRNKISKIAEHIGAEARDTAGLKTKINQYIKEIDKCILHLSE